jgi:hypothetical protein
VAEHAAEFRKLGAEILVVSFAPPPVVAEYERRSALPFLVVSDSSREAYRNLGLGRTTWGSMMRPGSILRYLKLIFRGWWPRKPGEGEDVLQLGGDFVLDGSRRLVYSHPSTEPTDRPPVQDLLQAVRLR